MTLPHPGVHASACPRPIRLLLAACLISCLASALRAADQSAEITLQRTLDQPFNLTFEKVPLSDAFKEIAATAKISLQVDPACYELLPYGATTLISADFRQSKLRDAIEEVLVPLGLVQTVSSATVIIRPSDPLIHIGHRADWQELKFLQDLRTGPDLKPDAQGNLSLESAIRASLDRPALVVSILADDGSTGGSGPNHDKAIKQITDQLPMSPFRALELYCQLTSTLWFVEDTALSGGAAGGTIHILPMKRWIARQLERPIQLSFTNAPLGQVVAELTHLSGIRFVPEPGLYQAVPVVTLNSNNGSVLQTLEALAGATGIAFDVREDSMLLHLEGKGGEPTTAPKSDTIIGRIALPAGSDGLSVDIFLRESDLPSDLNDLRKKKIQEAVTALQHALAPPTPTPATSPTTHPAK